METLLQLPSVDLNLRVKVDGVEGNSHSTSDLSHQYPAPGLTALEAAAQGGEADIVRLLLTTEPSLECEPAWFLAAAGGHLEILEILSGQGVEENLRDGEGRTALSHAVLASQEGAVRYLVEAGSDINIRDTEERSLLELALLQEDLEMVETLLECGAEMTPGLLELAVQLDSPASLTLLLEKGAPVNQHLWSLARGKHQLR